MSKGGVTSWAGLANHVGKNSAVDGVNRTQTALAGAKSVALTDLTPNPYNPRESLGDLQDLSSIADHQLQPAVAVTRAAFLQLFPDAQITAKWVVIIGNRRLAAAEKFGRPVLDIVVKNDLAKDRATLLAAVISENVDRKGFDVIEEARAVERLVHECGTAQAAKDSLKKSDTWISQRRALLRLDPTLQTALRSGDLAIREARELAKLPPAEQLAHWRNRTWEATNSDGDVPGEGRPAALTAGKPQPATTAPRSRSLARALRRFSTEPTALAVTLHQELGDAGAKTLIRLLRKEIT